MSTNVLGSEIVKHVLGRFKRENRLSILDAVDLGNKSKEELETWGLFCACLAWGSLKAKRNILISFYNNLNTSFTEFIKSPSQKLLRIIYKSDDGSLKLLSLCLAIRDLLEEHGSVSDFVRNSETVDHAIFNLASTLRRGVVKHTPYEVKKFNLPKSSLSPPITFVHKRRTSALKRYYMYFRWMIRDSEPDYGIWNFFDKRDLYHPLDLHVARILKRWRVLSDDSNDWYNVQQVTEYFKKVEPRDPLKYDYHLVTFGQKFCEKNSPMCWKCPVKPKFACNL